MTMLLGWSFQEFQIYIDLIQLIVVAVIYPDVLLMLLLDIRTYPDDRAFRFQLKQVVLPQLVIPHEYINLGCVLGVEQGLPVELSEVRPQWFILYNQVITDQFKCALQLHFDCFWSIREDVIQMPAVEEVLVYAVYEPLIGISLVVDGDD